MKDIVLPFEHAHAAHCESGVMSSMMRHYGLVMSEAMAFGLSSALNFAYLPFIKLGGLPLVAYRMPPKFIIKGLQKRLGVKMVTKTFRNADRAMQELDKQLEKGQIVGLQTGVFWLPYFPQDMRFHFNAHNIIVYGKEGDEYLISDPVFEHTVRCPSADLKKVRSVKGALAPKNLMYYPGFVPKDVDLRQPIRKSIKATIKIMNAPVPFVGLKGMRTLSRVIRKLKKRDDERYGRLFIAHLVRMQEEIGTGGAGFRFVYASYLQWAAKYLNSENLRTASVTMTEAGDKWRLFAAETARVYKSSDKIDYDRIADMIVDCATKESQVYDHMKAYLSESP